jgi:hypothetical protein
MVGGESMGTSIRRFVFVILAATLGLAITATGAAGAPLGPLTIPAGVSSVSNPPGGWRGGWGNTLLPDYTVSAAVGPDSTAAAGVYYIVNRSSATAMAPASRDHYFHSLVADGTMFTKFVDIEGTYAYSGSGGSREGVWYLHVLPYTFTDGLQDFSVSPVTYHVPIGIDLTPPSTPHNVRVSPDPSVAPSTYGVTSSTRATVYWDGHDYDSLSGTAYYSIYVNGLKAVSGAGDAFMSVPASAPPVWYRSTWTSGYSFTIEDMPAGRNEVQVTATDRAGNESALGEAVVIFNGIRFGVASSHGPRITRLSDSPDPFYPAKRDGFRDDSIVRFTLSKRAMVWLLVYDSYGTRVRLVTAGWRSRGRRSLKWDGKLDDGKTVAPHGTYRIYVGADDGAGHVTISRARTTSLRWYIVQRLGHGSVRIVYR